MQRFSEWFDDSGLSWLSSGLVAGLVFLLPLIVLPIADQPVIATKNLIIMVGSLVVAAIYLASIFVNRQIRLTVTPLTVPTLAFGAAVLLSSFLTNNYPVEHLLGLGGVYISACLLLLLAPSLLKGTHNVFNPLTALSLSTAALAVASVLQLFGWGPSLVLNQILPVSVPDTLIFNLSGSTLVATQFSLIALIGLVATFWKKRTLSLTQYVAAGITTVGLIVYGWSLLPSQPTSPVLLPWTASWSIVIDVMRSPRTALMGVGPEAFSNAYNQFKPIWMNSTNVWNVQFTQASNTIFSIMSTLGLLGLLTWLWIVTKVGLLARRASAPARHQLLPLTAMLATSLVINIALPPTTTLLIVQVVILVAWLLNQPELLSEVEIHGLTLRLVKNRSTVHPLALHHTLMVMSVSLIGLLAVAALSYGLARNTLAQVKVAQAITAMQQNDAIATYTLQQQAVSLNPYMDSYRRRYALTNVAIAAALSQKADRTEEENQQFSQLIQQAIREAKAAALLDASDASNWQTLAQVYQALIGTADGADQWTVSSYVKAVETAPLDPQTRVELGGVFYASGQYDEAIRLFQQAIGLKADYVNAYYNLANAYARQNKTAEAKVAYQQTLLLLAPDSEEYVKVSDEMNKLDSETTVPKQPAPGSTPSPEPQPNQAPSLNNDQTPTIDPAAGANSNLNSTTGELITSSPTPSPAPIQNSDL